MIAYRDIQSFVTSLLISSYLIYTITFIFELEYSALKYLICTDTNKNAI